MEKIFDTLTEFCQGPCKENQLIIANSKFLEYSLSLLKGDQNIYDASEKDLFEDISQLKTYRTQYTLANHPGLNSNEEASSGQSHHTIEPWKVERLRYKCLITIMSLIEQVQTKDSVLYRITRAMPLKVLKKNLTRIYSLFKKAHKGKYNLDVFGWYDKQIDQKIDIKLYECVIENGFNIFNLICTILEIGGVGNNTEYRQLKEDLKKIDMENTRSGSILGNLLSKTGSVLNSVICCFGMCNRRGI